MNITSRILSEKAKEGRRRRQRERRRRQREERKNEDYYDCFDIPGFDDYDLYGRHNFIVCEGRDKESRQMEKIFIERNRGFLSNIRNHCFSVIDVKIIDDFIAKTQPTDNLRQFQISGRDLCNGKKLYNQMKDDPEPNYEIFGSNGNGCDCFSLYKSNDKNMYIIIIDGHNNNTPTHYVKIENEEIFGK